MKTLKFPLTTKTVLIIAEIEEAFGSDLSSLTAPTQKGGVDLSFVLVQTIGLVEFDAERSESKSSDPCYLQISVKYLSLNLLTKISNCDIIPSVV